MARRLAQLFANALKRRGRTIYLRTVQMGPSGPIPALLTTPVLGAALEPGATTLVLNCASASGQLCAGDTIILPGAPPTPLTVGGTAQATPLALNSQPGFASVPLAAAYAGTTMASGTAVTLTFAADTPILALVNTYPVNLVDGTLIEAFDLRVVIAAWQQTAPDPSNQKLVIDGQVRSILRVDPTIGPGGELEKWAVQAR